MPRRARTAGTGPRLPGGTRSRIAPVGEQGSRCIEDRLPARRAGTYASGWAALSPAFAETCASRRARDGIHHPRLPRGRAFRIRPASARFRVQARLEQPPRRGARLWRGAVMERLCRARLRGLHPSGGEVALREVAVDRQAALCRFSASHTLTPLPTLPQGEGGKMAQNVRQIARVASPSHAFVSASSPGDSASRTRAW